MKRNNSKIEFQKNWNTVYETMEDNLALMLLVLHDEYGFGRERIGKLLASMTETVKRFDEYQADGVLDIKRAELTENFLDVKDLHEFLKVRLKGVVPEEFYNELFYKTTPALYEAQAKSKHNAMKRQQTVPIAEAAEIQRKVHAMKKFLEDRSGNNGQKSAL